MCPSSIYSGMTCKCIFIINGDEYLKNYFHFRSLKVGQIAKYSQYLSDSGIKCILGM